MPNKNLLTIFFSLSLSLVVLSSCAEEEEVTPFSGKGGAAGRFAVNTGEMAVLPQNPDTKVLDGNSQPDDTVGGSSVEITSSEKSPYGIPAFSVEVPSDDADDAVVPAVDNDAAFVPFFDGENGSQVGDPTADFGVASQMGLAPSQENDPAAAFVAEMNAAKTGGLGVRSARLATAPEVGDYVPGQTQVDLPHFPAPPRPPFYRPRFPGCWYGIGWYWWGASMCEARNRFQKDLTASRSQIYEEHHRGHIAFSYYHPFGLHSAAWMALKQCNAAHRNPGSANFNEKYAPCRITFCTITHRYMYFRWKNWWWYHWRWY